MSAVVEPQVLRSGRAISTRRNANVPPAGEKPGLDIRSLNLNYELMLRLEDVGDCR
jgi:hypothetical protein